MKFTEELHTEVVKRERLGSEYRENAYVHLESVRTALDAIPEQYRMSAVFEIRTWLDRDGIEEHAMTVSYERPPTKSEIEAQIEESRKRVAEEINWFHKRAKEILREAAECGYSVPDEKWPFKADQPAALDEN
jgi:hypothetical protein|nr:hypothetical protein [Neorhizobium tomejilense]